MPKGTFERINVNIPLEKKHVDHVQEQYKEWNGDGELYTSILSQVFPYSINAVIWYQGESDTSLEESEVYALQLSELIKVWRNDFRDERLPFIIIQIADFVPRNDDAWRGVQKAQLEVQTLLSNVQTVISADVCENNDIHPKTKVNIAKRVAEVLMNFIDKKECDKNG